MDRNDQLPAPVAILQIKYAEWTLGDDLDINIGMVFSRTSREKSYKCPCKREMICGSKVIVTALTWTNRRKSRKLLTRPVCTADFTEPGT